MEHSEDVQRLVLDTLSAVDKIEDTGALRLAESNAHIDSQVMLGVLNRLKGHQVKIIPINTFRWSILKLLARKSGC